MSRTASLIVLALFLGAAPIAAIAQTETTPATPPEAPAAQSQDNMGMQSSEQPATLDQSKETPTTSDTSKTVTDTPTPAPTPQAQSPEPMPDSTTQAEKSSQPESEQIVLQDDDSILATSMLGTSVYAPNDEVVGDINDIIVNTDGTVQGVVIGVGGFLGLGEKNVAVTMKSLTLMPETDGSVPRLVLNSTKEELEAAPEFMSVADQAAEAKRTQPVLPAPAPAPAD